MKSCLGCYLRLEECLIVHKTFSEQHISARNPLVDYQFLDCQRFLRDSMEVLCLKTA